MLQETTIAKPGEIIPEVVAQIQQEDTQHREEGIVVITGQQLSAVQNVLPEDNERRVEVNSNSPDQIRNTVHPSLFTYIAMNRNSINQNSVEQENSSRLIHLIAGTMAACISAITSSISAFVGAATIEAIGYDEYDSHEAAVAGLVGGFILGGIFFLISAELSPNGLAIKVAESALSGAVGAGAVGVTAISAIHKMDMSVAQCSLASGVGTLTIAMVVLLIRIAAGVGALAAGACFDAVAHVLPRPS